MRVLEVIRQGLSIGNEENFILTYRLEILRYDF